MCKHECYIEVSARTTCAMCMYEIITKNMSLKKMLRKKKKKIYIQLIVKNKSIAIIHIMYGPSLTFSLFV